MKRMAKPLTRKQKEHLLMLSGIKVRKAVWGNWTYDVGGKWVAIIFQTRSEAVTAAWRYNFAASAAVR